MADTLAEDVDRVGRIDAVPAILDVVCRMTGMGFAAIARVTEDRWVACAVKDNIDFGLKPGGELKVETTICNEIRQSNREVVIDHVAEDKAFCTHPTPAMYGFQSYISVPIVRADHSFFGTLCAIDPSPAKINRPEVIEMFRLFGQLVAVHLDMQEKLEASEAALFTERQANDLRDQFIAVLGHDLRNPLASISSGVSLLKPATERDRTVLGMMQKSVNRMAELINNVLDLARGRLGEGLTLDRVADGKLVANIEQVIDELRSANPGRTIRADLTLTRLVPADPARIGQLLSNLVANALTHGAQDKPVYVSARTDNTAFELSVANEGSPIPLEIRQRLFQPFFRSSGASQGLGLGLYIASEIANAHGGALTVASDASGTRFTFRLPLL